LIKNHFRRQKKFLEKLGVGVIQYSTFAFTPMDQDLEFQIPVTPHLRDHLAWWRGDVMKGPNSPQCLLNTDYRRLEIGVGRSVGRQNNPRYMVPDRVGPPHQCPELEAVRLSLAHFREQVRGKTVMIPDNFEKLEDALRGVFPPSQ
jgi:hypothetical protein